MIRITPLALIVAALTSSFFVSGAYAAEPETAKTAVVDLAKAKQIVEGVCVACHGADGNSPLPNNPKLAGQIPEYLYKQLSNFKSIDGKPPVRNNPTMGAMAIMLNEADMKSVAAYLSQQKLQVSAETTADPALIAEGQKLWRAGNSENGTPACTGCHGPSGKGLPAQYPRLAAQHAEYIENQLKMFSTGERANDSEKVMRMIAAKLSDRQKKALAEYIASLR
ncbi:MAG: c-type cytochrome [Pseudomonadota bacterium]